MTRCVDLHTHTTASDGSLAPDALVRLARQIDLAAVAITDHDTVAGCAPALAAGADLGIEVVPGVEVSVVPELPGQLHLLGLLLDPGDPGLLAWLQGLREARNRRNPKIIERLQALGISITLAEVEARAREDAAHAASGGSGLAEGESLVVGRPHIAEVLLDKGVVRSGQEAFTRYLTKGAPAYVDRERATPAEAIDVIHRAGGLAVIAHPQYCQARNREELAAFLRRLKDLGLDGMEIHYPTLTDEEAATLAWLARTIGLLASGGSDFHGEIKPGLQLGTGYGRLRVPQAVLDELKQARDARRR